MARTPHSRLSLAHTRARAGLPSSSLFALRSAFLVSPSFLPSVSTNFRLRGGSTEFDHTLELIQCFICHFKAIYLIPQSFLGLIQNFNGFLYPNPFRFKSFRGQSYSNQTVLTLFKLCHPVYFLPPPSATAYVPTLTPPLPPNMHMFRRSVRVRSFSPPPIKET